MDVLIHAGGRTITPLDCASLSLSGASLAAAHGRTAAFDIGRTCHALLRHAVGTDRLRQCGAGRRMPTEIAKIKLMVRTGYSSTTMRKITRRLPETFPLRNRGRPDLS